MKINPIFSFLLFILFSFLFSNCSDDELPDDGSYRANCQGEMGTDSLSTATLMLGEWAWFHANCTWVGGDSLSNQGVILSVSENQLELKNDTVLVASNWQLDSVGVNSFVLNLNGASKLLMNGTIVVCENELSFNDMPLDGCRHFFRKTE